MIHGSYYNGFAPRDGEPELPLLWIGCVGAWCPSLGPTGVFLRDWSGRQNHGTLTGMTLSSAWTISDRYALLFDGVNDYVDLGNSPVLFCGTDDTTISIWANQIGTTNNNQLIFVGSESSKNSIYLHVASDSRLQFGTWAVGSSDVPTMLASTFQDGKWHHLAGTKSGTTFRLYFDGVLQQEKIILGVNVTAGYGALGGLPTMLPFPGYLDDARIYSRALSEAEIALLCKAGRAGAYQMRRRPLVRSPQRVFGGATMTGGMYVNQAGGMVG